MILIQIQGSFKLPCWNLSWDNLNTELYKYKSTWWPIKTDIFWIQKSMDWLCLTSWESGHPAEQNGTSKAFEWFSRQNSPLDEMRTCVLISCLCVLRRSWSQNVFDVSTDLLISNSEVVYPKLFFLFFQQRNNSSEAVELFHPKFSLLM